jgi:hypothetical protein
MLAFGDISTMHGLMRSSFIQDVLLLHGLGFFLYVGTVTLATLLGL